MYKLKRVSVIVVIISLMIFVGNIHVFAVTEEQNGLEVSITTDKTQYDISEQVKMSITFNNKSNVDIENITFQSIFPKEYRCSDDTKTIGTLKNGKNTKADIFFTVNTQKETSDKMDMIILIVILSVLLVIIFVLVGVLITQQKQKTQFMSLILIVSVIIGIISHSSVYVFADEIENQVTKSFSLLEEVKIDDKNKSFGIKVSYLLPDNKQNTSNAQYGQIYSNSIDEAHIYHEENDVSYIDNEILIVTKDGTTKEAVYDIAKKYQTEVVGMIEISGDYQLKTKNKLPVEELNALVIDIQKENIIETASLNYVRTYSSNDVEESNGFYYGKKWQNDLQNNTDAKGKSWGLEAIETIGAWELLNKNSQRIKPVKVGIVDGGFDINHKDLGFAEWFYEDGKNDKSSNEKSYINHGTHVSGIIGAKNNDNKGICGVYPYGDNNLYALSIENLTKYSENGDWAISSMHHKVAYAELIVRNIKVINESMGFNWYKYGDFEKNRIALKKWIETNDFSAFEKVSSIFADFLNRMLQKGYDFVIVSAAGNDSNKSVGHLESKYMSWTNLIGEKKYLNVYNRIIVVGAVDKKFNVSYYSNGGTRVDIYAPGDNIYSTTYNNGYGYDTGTSMAAPHVSGVAAMVWSANNNLTGSEVKKIVCETRNKRCISCQMVDAHSAVEKALKRDTVTTDVNPERNSVVAMAFVVNADNENDVIADAKLTFTAKNNKNKTYTTESDKYGHFEISIPKGEYNLSVRANKYTDYTGSVSIKSDGVNYIDKVRMKKQQSVQLQHTQLPTAVVTPQISDYDTAEDLINKPVTEIVKMMDKSFNLKTEGGSYYFYNYDKLPGMDFFIKGVEYGQDEKAKEMINNGFVDIWGIQVNSSGKGCRNGDKILKADMDFAQCAEIYGKFSCQPTTGAFISGAMEALGYKQEKDTYTITINFKLTDTTLPFLSEATATNNYGEISYDKMLKANPPIRNIVIVRNETEYKYYIHSEKIQKYNDRIYYTSEFQHEGITGQLDLSSLDSKYIALPRFTDKQIDNFVIYNDKIYFTDQAVGTSPEPKLSTLYQCNMNGNNLIVIDRNTDKSFLLEYNTIRYSLNSGQEFRRYDITTNQVQNIEKSNNYIVPSQIFTWEQQWGIENGARYLNGIYYKEIHDDPTDYSHNILYYRKDILTGEVVQIGKGYTPSR